LSKEKTLVEANTLLHAAKRVILNLK
jgi:hypothetical protein